MISHPIHIPLTSRYIHIHITYTHTWNPNDLFSRSTPPKQGQNSIQSKQGAPFGFQVHLFFYTQGLLERMRLRSWAVVKLWPVKCSVPRRPDELQGMNNLEIQCWVLFKVFILNNLGKVLKFEVHFLCTECLRMPTRNGKVWRNILCTQMYRVDCCD